jgi:hypothetical protein
MPAPLQLPEGLTVRSLVPSDATAVFEVIAAMELDVLGEVVIEEADIVSDWQRPSGPATAVEASEPRSRPGCRSASGSSVPERPLPQGYTVRAAAEAEHRDCWTVTEDAFLAWSVRDRQSYEDWAAGASGRPGFEPWNLRVTVDPGGEVVGWVNRAKDL